MMLVAEMMRSLAQRRIGQPDQPATPSGAKLLDEVAMCQAALATIKEAIVLHGMPTGEDAAAAIDTLRTVQNWALSLQQAATKLPADHPMRLPAAWNNIREIDREAHDLANRIDAEPAIRPGVMVGAPAPAATPNPTSSAEPPAPPSPPAPSNTPPSPPPSNTPPANTPPATTTQT